MSSDSLPEFINALNSHQAYPHPVHDLKMVQTHVSWVFLTGDFVYKIKKPVHFTFLDFSTLDKRKHYCEEEVRLNARLCPDLYLEVVPILKKGNNYVIGNSSEFANAFDFAVKMKQLPEERRMNHLLEQKQITLAHMESIAHAVFDFHQKAEIIHERSYADPDDILSQARDLTSMYPVLESEFSLISIVDFVLRRMQRFVETSRELLLKRSANGFIRDCHGDLHSANIFLIDSKPYIFDCIEFNKSFRFIDVAREIAFMAMDLEAHGREDLSVKFINAYQSLANDPDLPKLLTFYKCYYANVRAKVAGLEFQQTKNSDARERMRKYLRLCEKYAERLG